MQLRSMRKKKGLSLKQLSDLSGYAEITLGRYERGNRKPDSDALVVFARILGCTVDDLIGNPTEAPARRRRTTGASTRSAA